MGQLFLECTEDSEKVYQCRYCGTALTTVEKLLSKVTPHASECPVDQCRRYTVSFLIHVLRRIVVEARDTSSRSATGSHAPDELEILVARWGAVGSEEVLHRKRC